MRVDDHLTLVPGFAEYLEWSENNMLLSCCEDGSEFARALQEKKIGKFGLISHFTRGIHICGSPTDKQKRLVQLVRESGVPPEEIAVIGDRPSSELSTAVELGLQVYRMMLLDEFGIPEGKYGYEILHGRHEVVHDWHDLMKRFPNLGASGIYELQQTFQP